MTNPIFEAAGAWDLLCDIATNRMVVHKDIFAHHPASWAPAANPIVVRSGTIKAESAMGAGEDEVVRVPTKDGGAPQKTEFTGRPDSADNVFIDDVRVFSCLAPISRSLSLSLSSATAYAPL